MAPIRELHQRHYLTHHEPSSAAPANVARLLRAVADNLDELPAGTEVVDMTLTPALHVADGTTLTTYLDGFR